MLDYTTEIEGKSIKVYLNGDLDIECTEFLEDELLSLVLEYKVVDFMFENVAFVDSSGIGLLINMIQELQKLDREVTISHIRADVLEVFELLQIPDIVGKNIFR